MIYTIKLSKKLARFWLTILNFIRDYFYNGPIIHEDKEHLTRYSFDERVLTQKTLYKVVFLTLVFTILSVTTFFYVFVPDPVEKYLRDHKSIMK